MKQGRLEEEFINLVMQSQGIVHKVCRMYCQDAEQRKDLFQEILIQLWKSYPSFRGDSKFSTWMYRVALNVAIQDLNKSKKSQQVILSDVHLKNTVEEYNDDFEDRIKRMHKAIGHLNKIEKAIIMLYLEEKPYQEIADIVGITQNYVRVKMNRIKSKLAKHITTDGITGT